MIFAGGFFRPLESQPRLLRDENRLDSRKNVLDSTWNPLGFRLDSKKEGSETSVATRRCISSKVVESNAFYKLSLGAQALYAHLVMAADDLGFCNNYDGVTCRIPKGEAALQELINKRFVLNFGEIMVNRIEPNRTEPNRSGERAADSERKAWFDRILSAYPVHRQGNTGEAWAAFESFVPDGQEQAALDALDKWKKSEQWTDDGGRFVPGLSKWLVQGLWKCPPETELPSGNGQRMAYDPDQLAAIRRMLQEDNPKGGG